MADVWNWICLLFFLYTVPSAKCCAQWIYRRVWIKAFFGSDYITAVQNININYSISVSDNPFGSAICHIQVLLDNENKCAAEISQKRGPFANYFAEKYLWNKWNILSGLAFLYNKEKDKLVHECIVVISLKLSLLSGLNECLSNAGMLHFCSRSHLLFLSFWEYIFPKLPSARQVFEET